MIRTSNGAILTAAFAIALGIRANAQAQIAQPAPRMAQGWVMSVHAGNGQGVFRIKTGARNNNLAGGATQQFIVGPATSFDAVGSRGRVPASFASLRPGQRVMVQAQGPQAIGVRILPRNQYAGVLRQANYGHSLRAPRGLTATSRIGQPFVLNMSHNVAATHAPHGSSHMR
jgi:hypothetical protein